MKEWPEFFRHRELGWLSLGFIRTSIVSGIKGGIAEIMRRLWRIFFCGDDLGFSFPIGCRCPLEDGRLFLVQGHSCHKFAEQLTMGAASSSQLPRSTLPAAISSKQPPRCILFEVEATI
jgi:hypothetical protein